DLDSEADRRERVAKLVAEHREELVLAARGFLQNLFGHPLLGDVDAGADVAFERAVGIDVRNAVVEQPAVLAVVATQAKLHRQRRALRKGRVARLDASLAVVRMNRLGPAEAELVVERAPGEVEP